MVSRTGWTVVLGVSWLVLAAGCQESAPSNPTSTGPTQGRLARAAAAETHSRFDMDILRLSDSTAADAVHALAEQTPLAVRSWMTLTDATGAVAISSPIRAEAPVLSGLADLAFEAPFAGATAMTNLRRHTAQQLDTLCSHTTLPHQLPSGAKVELVLPRLLTIQDRFEVVEDSQGNEIVVDIDEGAGPVSYRLLSGVGLACADRAYRPLFLSPTPSGSTVIRSYEHDLRYLCLQLSDADSCARQVAGVCPAGCSEDASGACLVADGTAATSATFGEPRWYCLPGQLADGVAGHAVLQHAYARPFLAGSLKWEGNVWNRHFEVDGTLGGIATRPTTPSGFVSTEGWNLNPRDTHPAGGSKAKHYVAAVGVSMALGVSGPVALSPYTFADRTASGGAVDSDPQKLNQCESTTTETFFDQPALASDGTLDDGILVQLSAASSHAPAAAGCSWGRLWGIEMASVSQATAVDGAGCKAFDVGTAAGPVLGANIADSRVASCSTWNRCKGEHCCLAALYVGRDVTCAIKTDSTVWCWGENTTGKLGRGYKSFERLGPAPVLVAPDTPFDGVVEVTLGSHIGCARRSDNTVWCWGSNLDGAIGLGTTDEDAHMAEQVRDASGSVMRATQISAGRDFVCVLKDSGTVWCWGVNKSGLLGAGVDQETLARSLVPVQVLQGSGGAPLTDVVELRAGRRTNCARKRDGSLWCWGRGDVGQRGDGSLLKDMPYAVAVTTETGPLAGVIGLHAGRAHGCAIRQDRTVWCWGFGGGGELGDGTTDTRAHAQPVLEADGSPFVGAVEIADWDSGSCARKGDGTLWCWGSGPAVGIGAAAIALNPAQVTYEDGTPVTTAARLAPTESYVHMCMERTDGTAWCWGEGLYGQLGIGVFEARSHPTKVSDFSCCTPATCEAAGAQCGVVDDQCGATIDCGGCKAPATCGGGGTANICGGGCVPASCEATSCGPLDDGCGGTLDCGACADEPKAPPKDSGGCGIALGVSATPTSPSADGQTHRPPWLSLVALGLAALWLRRKRSPGA